MFKQIALLFVVITLSLPFTAGAASLFVDPKDGVYDTQQQVVVSVFVDTSNTAINAVSGVLNYPSTQLSLQRISLDESIVDIWMSQPKNEGSKIKFEGIVLNPGYSGNKGLVMTLYLTPLKSGSAQIYIDNASVLSNDGLGTNVLNKLSGTTLRFSQKTAIAPITDFKPVLDTQQSTVATLSSGLALPVVPVITEYPVQGSENEPIRIAGTALPYNNVRVTLADISPRTVGEKIISLFKGTNREQVFPVVTTDENGYFETYSSNPLVAGVYSGWVEMIGKQGEVVPSNDTVTIEVGYGTTYKLLIAIINILALIIPIILLVLLIIFVPWYGFKIIHLLGLKFAKKERSMENQISSARNEDTVLNLHSHE